MTSDAASSITETKWFFFFLFCFVLFLFLFVFYTHLSIATIFISFCVACNKPRSRVNISARLATSRIFQCERSVRTIFLRNVDNEIACFKALWLDDIWSCVWCPWTWNQDGNFRKVKTTPEILMKKSTRNTHLRTILLKGVLHLLPQKAPKLVCLVLYLDLKIINIFFKNNIWML